MHTTPLTRNMSGIAVISSLKYRLFQLAILIWVIAEGCSHQSAIQKNGKPPMQNAGSDTAMIRPGELWYDDKGELINAHGGGIIHYQNKYYWFGEKRGKSAAEGVSVYSSTDLYKWKQEAVAFVPDKDTLSDVAQGCIIERPKVLYNDKTKKFVMWFHLELRKQGYKAARAAVAISDNIIGPYKFIRSFRPNGNMSRDMNLYKDDNGAAYIIYSSRENYDLRIAQLTSDYCNVTPIDSMVFSNHREAPAVFKYENKYYLITSGCTGWQPNKASLHTATNMLGPWVETKNNPMSGEQSATTFNGQSTYVLPIAGRKNEFIFLADKWNPANLKDSRYLWLPVQFKNETVVIDWMDSWNLNWFKNKK